MHTSRSFLFYTIYDAENTPKTPSSIRSRMSFNKQLKSCFHVVFTHAGLLHNDNVLREVTTLITLNGNDEIE